MLEETVAGCYFRTVRPLCDVQQHLEPLDCRSFVEIRMRVDALCKPHTGIGCNLDTPKHLIHLVTHSYSCISLDIGNLHSVMFRIMFVILDYSK